MRHYSLPSTHPVAVMLTSVLTWCQGSVVRDANWIYIEPNAGIISACLPFLTNIFGQQLREVMDWISNLSTRTIALVRIRMKSYVNIDATQEGGPTTHRAAHESYKLHDDDDRAIPGFRDQFGKAESIQSSIETV